MIDSAQRLPSINPPSNNPRYKVSEGEPVQTQLRPLRLKGYLAAIAFQRFNFANLYTDKGVRALRFGHEQREYGYQAEFDKVFAFLVCFALGGPIHIEYRLL